MRLVIQTISCCCCCCYSWILRTRGQTKVKTLKQVKNLYFERCSSFYFSSSNSSLFFSLSLSPHLFIHLFCKVLICIDWLPNQVYLYISRFWLYIMKPTRLKLIRFVTLLFCFTQSQFFASGIETRYKQGSSWTIERKKLAR